MLSIFGNCIALFQYNAWATPCNNKIECDSEIDETICDSPNWHRWIAITSILFFFITLFLSFLKFKFKLKKKGEGTSFQMHAVHCQYFSLDREHRALLVLRLEAGGRKEAIKVYNNICNEQQNKAQNPVYKRSVDRN